LENVNLEVERGGIFAVVGPSGAGKTTLLRLVDLLDYPTSGRIIFDGVDTGPRDVRYAVRRRMGMVFQQPVLFDTTVHNNVAWSLRMRGFGRREVDERVRAILGRMGLQGFQGRGARTLSGGEAQRVAIARALVYEPELMLLDEPTANLDPYNVATIEGIVNQMNRELGITVVMATHNLFQAARVGHRAAFLLNGEVVEVAEAQRLVQNPEDKRTASFVRGEMIY